MGEITKNLGRHYLLAGFLPAAALLIITNLAFQPYLPKSWQLALERAMASEIGGDLAVYLLIPLILGALFTSLAPQILSLYRLRLTPFRRLAQRRAVYTEYSQGLAALKERFAETKRALDSELAQASKSTQIEALRSELAILQGKLNAILAEMRKAGGGALLLEAEHLQSSRLCNVFAWIEEYPEQRYGMVFGTLWPRLEAVLPKELSERVEARYTILALLLNLSLVCLVFALLWLGLGLSGTLGYHAPAPWSWGATFIVALAAAYLFYRAAASQALQLAEIVHSAFDLYRGELLERYQVNPPNTLEGEVNLWRQMGQFIALGEAGYYPPIERGKKKQG